MTQIMKLVSIETASGEVIETAARSQEWFDNLKPKARKAYLAEHPNSKFGPKGQYMAKRRAEKKAGTAKPAAKKTATKKTAATKTAAPKATSIDKLKSRIDKAKQNPQSGTFFDSMRSTISKLAKSGEKVDENAIKSQSYGYLKKQLDAGSPTYTKLLKLAIEEYENKDALEGAEKPGKIAAAQKAVESYAKSIQKLRDKDVAGGLSEREEERFYVLRNKLKSAQAELNKLSK